MKNTKILILLTLTFMACNVKDALDLKDKIKGKKRKIEEVDSSEEKKKLPVGEEDFKNIIEGDYYYVDKTLFIPEMLKRGAKVTAVMRPKRFGKTMMLSTCKYFFDIEGEEENKKLFKGLNIEKSKYFQEQGKYPVIYLTFKDLKEESWENCLEKIGALISNEYQNHKNKINEALEEGNLTEVDKTYFDSAIKKSCSIVELEESLKHLSRYLYKCYGKKPVMLIDEYDTPIIEGELKGYQEQVKGFMSNLLSAGLKDNVNLYRGLMTGIVRMSGVGISNGVNNVAVFTVTSSKFSDKFGFEDHEVDKMLDYYGLNKRSSRIKDWYNGYNVGGRSLYNPFSVLRCIYEDGKIVNVWLESGENRLAKKKIEAFLQFGHEGSIARREVMEEILNGKDVEVKYKQDVSIVSGGMDEVLSLLLNGGYLTFRYIKNRERIDDKVRVVIPNKEVREVYIDTLDDLVYERYRCSKFRELLKNIEEGTEEKVRKGVQHQLMDASFHDVSEEKEELLEKDYHNFIHGIFRGFIDEYEVKSNRESGRGRYDLMMTPRKNSKKKRGIIVELKAEKASAKRKKDEKKVAKEKSKEGLDQILEREYDEEMRDRGIRSARLIGMGFVGKSVGVTIEDIKISS